jgi:hypothetical protein
MRVSINCPIERQKRLLIKSMTYKAHVHEDQISFIKIFFATHHRIFVNKYAEKILPNLFFAHVKFKFLTSSRVPERRLRMQLFNVKP